MRRFVQLGALFVLLTALAGVTSGSTVAAEQGIDPIFDRLTPAPYATVAPGPVQIEAHVIADAPFETVTLWIDGTQIEQLTAQSDSALSISHTSSLSEGTHTATVEALDGDGSYQHAQWDFVVSSTPGDGAWFTAAGQPKADQINATMRSLVEAFRWHFWGISWDGANHPEVPTHATYETVAVPAETGTIDQTSMTNVGPVNSTRGSVGAPTADGYVLPVQPNVAEGVLIPGRQFGDASYSLTMRKKTERGDAEGCLLLRVVDTADGGRYQACFVYSGTSIVGARVMYLAGAQTSVGQGVEPLSAEPDSFEDLTSPDVRTLETPNALTTDRLMSAHQ